MGFNVGPLTIHYYGLIVMAGVLAGAYLADRRARRRGDDPDIVWDSLIWVLIGGIIGARVWHILTPPPSMVERGITTGYYLSHPLDALAIWRGGLGIPGAVIGGGLALYVFSRRRGLSFLSWVDLAAPSLALGQAIGRWGNYVNQELYGAPTDLPWAIYIDPMHRLPAFVNRATYHPLFLYESLWNLANMFFLLWLGWKFAERLKGGDIFLPAGFPQAGCLAGRWLERESDVDGDCGPVRVRGLARPKIRMVFSVNQEPPVGYRLTGGLALHSSISIDFA
jgi:phosphatidylglycerol:prolipoprotein diacylglycerol transferase